MSRLFFGIVLVACVSASMSRQARCADPVPKTLHVTIDAGKTREPLSKYVYGQFIEHLGRCIYGGIWAEMLEDRKFFYSVGAKQSPWKAIGADKRGDDGPRQTLRRASIRPQIMLRGDGQSAGIVQGQLALRKGKQYVGPDLVGRRGNGRAVKVSLVWGDGQDQRQTITVRHAGFGLRENAAAIHRRGRYGRGRLEITAAGNGSFHVGTVSPDAGRQRTRHEGRHAGIAQATRRPRISLARRQFRERLQLAGRHRRARPPPAAEEPGLARHRAQRFRAR